MSNWLLACILRILLYFHHQHLLIAAVLSNYCSNETIYIKINPLGTLLAKRACSQLCSRLCLERWSWVTCWPGRNPVTESASTMIGQIEFCKCNKVASADAEAAWRGLQNRHQVCSSPCLDFITSSQCSKHTVSRSDVLLASLRVHLSPMSSSAFYLSCECREEPACKFPSRGSFENVARFLTSASACSLAASALRAWDKPICI